MKDTSHHDSAEPRPALHPAVGLLGLRRLQSAAVPGPDEPVSDGRGGLGGLRAVPDGAQAPYQPQASSFQQTGQQFAAAPQQDSFFANLMDTSRGFVNRFGKLAFILAVVAIGVNLFFTAIMAGLGPAGSGFDLDLGRFFFSLVFSAPWALAQIILVRLFIEFVRNTTSSRGAAA